MIIYYGTILFKNDIPKFSLVYISEFRFPDLLKLIQNFPQTNETLIKTISII